MTVTGKVINGALVLPAGTKLPEGADITLGLAGDDSQSEKIFDWLHDQEFLRTYKQAEARVGRPQKFIHKQRSYVLMQLLKMLGKPRGAIAECGVFEGMTSIQMCAILRKFHSAESPVNYCVFDSFEGTSPRETRDVENQFHPNLSLPGKTLGKGGYCSCSLEQVKQNLSDFEFISYHKGWIPDCFAGVDDLSFSFVHIDVDLYQPILDAARFFHPRLLTGGMIVFDDYGFLDWPGAKKAVEEFVAETNQPILRLPTGQAVLFKNS